MLFLFLYVGSYVFSPYVVSLCDFVYYGSVYIGGYGGLSELCPVSFPVVGECPSYVYVRLYSERF